MHSHCFALVTPLEASAREFHCLVLCPGYVLQNTKCLASELFHAYQTPIGSAGVVG